MTLTEILLTYDLSDEMGRTNLVSLFSKLLTKEDIEETTISIIAKCFESIIPEQDERLQFFVDTVRGIVDPNPNTTGSLAYLSHPLVNELLKKDPNLQVKVSSCKINIMELKEKETNALNSKDYESASKFAEELVIANETMTNLIHPHLSDSSIAVSN